MMRRLNEALGEARQERDEARAALDAVRRALRTIQDLANLDFQGSPLNVLSEAGDIAREALADLAVQIAIAAPEVGQALGVTPDSAQALMPQMKTALNQTRCERAQHLCVAPTFRKDARLLWAVVDLTDMRLVGTK